MNNTTRERRDHYVLYTSTKRIRVLGPRTVQESRSSHWYGYTVSVRTRAPEGQWTEIYREDLRGTERWDPSAANKIGGVGAVVTDVPADEALQAAIASALESLGEKPGTYIKGRYFAS